MSTTSPDALTADDTDLVVDLVADDTWEDTYSPQRVVSWLRSSEGSLGERAMKLAAADLIEAHLTTLPNPGT